jgi:NAD+ synthase (glutamine-hydrolysing)
VDRVTSGAVEAGFLRVAACSAPVKLGEPLANARAVLDQARLAAAGGARLAVFPELALTGYSLDDLFMQELLLQQTVAALDYLTAELADLPLVVVVGAPMRAEHRLYNCAFVLVGGEILGAVPKSYLPNYREFYEHRQFASGLALDTRAEIGRHEFAVSRHQVFDFSYGLPSSTAASFKLGVEICEDLWVPLTPGAEAALAGAEVIVNPSGSPITIAKARERASLCESQSSKLICGYVYAAAGIGESSTDLSWDGQTLIFERGELLAKGPRFSRQPVITMTDLDLVLIRQDRLRQGSFDDNRVDFRPRLNAFRHVVSTLPEAELPAGTADSKLLRAIPRFPFVPNDPARLDQDCYEAYSIQVSALTQRLTAIGAPKIVIGVSGGLDSSHALIVAAKAMDQLGRPRSEILAYTLPGFATAQLTKANAIALAAALGTSIEEIDITDAARRMLEDLHHPFADGKPVYDVTFENVQAGLRTDYLFRLANYHGGIVLGTGDLSELALGWCTYGVGDQMSHYNVNSGVPKTLIQHLIRWVAKTQQFDDEVSRLLEAVLNTEISPELVPPTGCGSIQSTQAVVGPYELQDFTLYYTLRFGLTPAQVFFRQRQAWEDPSQGEWPEAIAQKDRRGYTPAELLHWLEVFYSRFFSSQFKRSALPNGPKVLRGGTLSPRGDWRQPSDFGGGLWQAQLFSLKQHFGELTASPDK